jgi:hypothetical protein
LCVGGEGYSEEIATVHFSIVGCGASL